MQTQISDARFGPRAFTQNTSEYFKVEGLTTVIINCTAVSSGTFKLYGSMDYGVATTPTWVPIGTVDSSGLRKAGDTVVTPATTKSIYATVAGYTHIRITEQNAGTFTLQVAATHFPLEALTSGLPTTTEHGKTLKTYSGTFSTDTDVIAAVTGKRIKVYAYSVINTSNTAETPLFKSGGTSGTELWRVHTKGPAADTPFGANLAVTPPAFIFATVAGEKLTVDVNAGATLHVSLAYFDDDAS